MADIVNLRNVRKRKAREAREAAAETNRLKFGRTKSDRALSKAEQEIESQRLDGHRRED